jgi:carboxyl-terminal processing protease
VTKLHKILKDLLDKKPKGLILDLRNNTGGYLNAAIEIVSEFIPQGAVMYEQYGDGTKKTFEALGGGIAYDIPLVVLVNEGSASASEITAGAIQDLGRGKLVGVTTYGKGSVQNWTELQNHQGAVRITVARWLTPKERQINNVGLKPDFEIQFTEADVKDKKDPQLDKAIEILSQ